MLGCRECSPDAPKYVSVDELEIHITSDHLDFSPYECERCRFAKFPTLYALKMHCREVHQLVEFYVRYKYSEEYERKMQEAKLRLHQCIQETTHSKEGPERSGESTPMPASPNITPPKFKRLASFESPAIDSTLLQKPYIGSYAQKNACPRSAPATVQQTSRPASQAMTTTSGLRVHGFQFFEGPKGFMHLRSKNSEKVDYKKILALKWPAEVLSLTTPPHPALSVEEESFMYLIKVYNEVAAVVYTYKYAGEVIDLNLLSKVKVTDSEKEKVRNLLRDNLPRAVAEQLPHIPYRSIQAIAADCPDRKRAKRVREAQDDYEAWDRRAPSGVFVQRLRKRGFEGPSSISILPPKHLFVKEIPEELLCEAMTTTSGLRVNGFQFFEGPKGFMHLRSNNSEKVDYKKILALKWPAEVLSLTTPPHPALSVEEESFMYLIKVQKYKGALPEDLTSDALRPWNSIRGGRKMHSRSRKVLILNDQIMPARINDQTDFELRTYYGDNPKFDRLNKKIYLVCDVKDGSVYNEVAAVLYTYKYAGEVIDLNLLSKVKVKDSEKEKVRNLLRDNLPRAVAEQLPHIPYRSIQAIAADCPDRKRAKRVRKAQDDYEAWDRRAPSGVFVQRLRKRGFEGPSSISILPPKHLFVKEIPEELLCEAMTTTSGLRVNGFQFFEGPKGFMHLRSNNSEKVDYKKILALKWPAEVLSLTTPPHPALSVEEESFMYLIKVQKYKGALPEDLTSDALRPWNSIRGGRKMHSRSRKVLILNDQIMPARINDQTDFELRTYYGDNPKFDRLNKKIYLVCDVKDGSVYNEVAAVLYTYKYAGEVIDLNLLSKVKVKDSEKEKVRNLLRDNLPRAVAEQLPHIPYRSIQAIAADCPDRKRAKRVRKAQDDYEAWDRRAPSGVFVQRLRKRGFEGPSSISILPPKHLFVKEIPEELLCGRTGKELIKFASATEALSSSQHSEDKFITVGVNKRGKFKRFG